MLHTYSRNLSGGEEFLFKIETTVPLEYEAISIECNKLIEQLKYAHTRDEVYNLEEKFILNYVKDMDINTKVKVSLTIVSNKNFMYDYKDILQTIYLNGGIIRGE